MKTDSDDLSADLFLRRYLAVAPLARALIRSREVAFLRQVGFGPRLLDLGHGDGIFALEATRIGAPVFVAIDLSRKELLRARARKSARFYVVADMERLPFRDGVFSGALSNCVLEHVDSIERCLVETSRVLVPGGHYLATVVTDTYERLLFWPAVFQAFRLDFLARAYLNFLRRKFRHERYFSAERWIKTAKKSGFQVENVKPYVEAGRQRLMDIFLPFVAYSHILERCFGRAVLMPRRWPSGLLARIVRPERHPDEPDHNANLALFLRRPTLSRPT